MIASRAAIGAGVSVGRAPAHSAGCARPGRADVRPDRIALVAAGAVAGWRWAREGLRHGLGSPECCSGNPP